MQRREFSSVLCAQSHSGYCNFTPFVKILSRADLFMYTLCSNGDMLTKLDQTNTSDQRRCPVSQSPGKLHPWLLNTQRINEKDRKWSHISPYNSCSLVLLTQTQYLTPTHTHMNTHGWITDNWDCLCSTCAWKQLIFYQGVRNHPAATSSEKWSNLKALRTKCDIHDLDSSSSRAEPPCHNRADVIPIQTEGRGSEVKSRGLHERRFQLSSNGGRKEDRAREVQTRPICPFELLGYTHLPLLSLRGKHAERQWCHVSFRLQRQEIVILKGSVRPIHKTIYIFSHLPLELLSR